MTFGLTSDGFNAKRLPDIKSEMEQGFGTVFGSIDTAPESAFGQIIGVMSKPFTDVWEQMQNVYFSQYPDTAAGVSLDYAARLTGVTRRGATYSTGLAALEGNAGSVVPATTQFATDITGYVFQTITDATINNTDIYRIYLRIEAAPEATVFMVTVNGTDYSITTPAGSSIASVTTQIFDLLVANCAATLTPTSLGNGGLLLVAVSGIMTIESKAYPVGSPSDLLDETFEWYTPIEIQAVNKGNLPAPVDSLTVIINPVSGLDEVTNLTAITPGRDIETDAEFRLRRAKSLSITGAATVESIRSRILDPVEGVADVLDCFVFENDTDAIVDGRAPHSIEIVVNGGDEQEIADYIWQVKAGGISTVGQITKTVVDSMSINHSIKFSRPLARTAWVRLDVYLSTEENTFPSDGADQINAAILEYGKSVSIGDNLIYQRLYPPIYTVPGISAVDLYTALPTLDVEISGTYADLDALFAWFETMKSVLNISDTFVVESAGDTTDAALEAAKGSAPVQYDYFQIDNVATPAISYLGNLNDNTAPYPAYGITNISVGGTEVVIFDAAKINVNVH